jgi:hypothetical protein
MARQTKIQVMISSRCDDMFPAVNGQSLSLIRRDLKGEIEATSLFGKLIYEVWINEETPPQGGKWDSWEVCIQAAKDCDVLLALSNGNAGWGADGEDIGICHAELATALSTGPGKVRLISLGNIKTDRSDAGRRNARFQAYLAGQTLFRGSAVRTISELKERIKEALLDATISLTLGGVRASACTDDRHRRRPKTCTEAEDEVITVGPWTIATSSKADKFDSCTMSRSTDDINVSFVRADDGLALLLDSSKWRLERGRAYAVTLAAGQRSVDARALAETRGVTIALADRPFKEGMRTANVLEVRGEGTTLRVPLDGSIAALARLEAYFVNNSRVSSDTNPFVAPNHKQWSQAQYEERKTRNGVVKCYRNFVIGRYRCHRFY